MVDIRSLDLNSLSKGELITIIYELVDQIEVLKTRILDLEEKLSKKENANNQKRVLPLWVKPNVKNKKSKKRKKRTQAFVRMKDAPTATVFHSHEVCPDCGGILGNPSVCYSRQIIDIPITPAIVTEHIVFKRYCFSCKKRSYPTPDLSSYVIGKYRIGINLIGLISTMREEMRLPVETIQNHLKIFYHLKLSVGEIVKILHVVAGFGRKDYEHIKEQLLQSPVIHADETGGRENGKNGYFWNFSNDKLQFLLYRQSRGAKVVREILGKDGENYEGVIVSDFYGAYNEYAGFHQRCLVHYQRDIKELLEEYPADRILKRWANDIKLLFEKAKQYTGPPDNLPIGIKEQMREEKEAYFKSQLTRICEPYLERQTVFSKLNARALKYISELFTFVRFSNVLPDNNTAERALRHLVVSRKISGGTRSSKGSETKSILSSLFGTWRLQNLNPFEQTKLLLLQASCQRP
jgi:transposase